MGRKPRGPNLCRPPAGRKPFGLFRKALHTTEKIAASCEGESAAGDTEGRRQLLTGSMNTISTSRITRVSNHCLDSLKREEKSFRQVTSRVQLNLVFPVL